MSAETAVIVWDCVPVIEQTAAWLFLAIEPLPFGVALADVVDAVFQISVPAWWEQRRDAFLGNWSIVVVEVEIEEVTVRTYVDTLDWSIALDDCRDSGGCGVGDDDCPSLSGFGRPSG